MSNQRKGNIAIFIASIVAIILIGTLIYLVFTKRKLIDNKVSIPQISSKVSQHVDSENLVSNLPLKGDIYFTKPEEGLWISKPAGSQPVKYFVPDFGSSPYRDLGDYAWSPDKNSLAYVVNGATGGGPGGELWFLNLVTNKSTPLLNKELLGGLSKIRWSEDGKYILFNWSSEMYKQSAIIDVATKKVIEVEPPFELINNTQGAGARSNTLGWLPDNKKILSVNFLSFGQGAPVDKMGKSMEYGLWTFDATTSRWLKLFSIVGDGLLDSIVSPKMDELLYSVTTDLGTEIWMTKIENYSPRKVVSLKATYVKLVDYSPDGKSALLVADQKDLISLNLESGATKTLAATAANNGQLILDTDDKAGWSSDSQYVFYRATYIYPKDKIEIFVVDINSGKKQKITEGYFNVKWIN